MNKLNSHTPSSLSAQRDAARERLQVTKQNEKAMETRLQTNLASEVVKAGTNTTDDSAVVSKGAALPLTTDAPAVEKPLGETAADATAAVENPAATAATVTEKKSEPLSYDVGTPGANLNAPSTDDPNAAAAAAASANGAPVDPNSANPSQNGGGTPPSGDPPPVGPPPGPTPSERAQAMADRESDARQAQTIFMQMMADRRKAMMEMWKIIQDSANAIYGIITGVVAAKAQAVHNANSSWDKYIRDSDK